MAKIFIIVILSTICSYGQFRPNSIGVVYLTGETNDTYQLTISLPVQVLEKSDLNSFWEDQINNNVDFQVEITFFDKTGELLTIGQKVNFRVELWCENDGGLQYRPTWATSIEKKKFKRKIQGVNEIQNIACFVIINKTTLKAEHPDLKVSNDIRLEGDYNNDGLVDCFLWTYYDDAENCSGQPVNHLGINLQIGKRSFGLRCCGP